jgi:hypothetical protein
MHKKLTRLISSTILLVSIPLVASAASPSQSTLCAKDYVVQIGDSISAIAEKYFGSVLAYPIIVDATNMAAQEDSRYTKITSADAIEAGQVLCIPSREDAQAMPGGGLSSQDDAGSSQVPAGKPGYTQTIRFSLDSQVSIQPLQIRLTNPGEGTLRFTTNGTLPDADSTPYQSPINVDESTIIRAQAFDDAGNPVGDVSTKSYLVVDYNQTIPVISITAAQGDLDTLHANPTQTAVGPGRSAPRSRTVSTSASPTAGRASSTILCLRTPR